jgi:hypothetical protein
LANADAPEIPAGTNEVHRLIAFKGGNERMTDNTVFLKHPHGDEIKEVEATTEALSPLMAKGWGQVPAPSGQKPDIEFGIIRDSE